MNSKLYMAFAGAAVLGLYTWWIYGLGADSIEAKVITVTIQEDKRQADDAGDLKSAEAKHEPQIIERIKVVRAAPDPSGCRDIIMPADVLRALGSQ